jgi:dihydroorotate dehydrogenase (NAD+) catalytic subunit
MAIIELAPRHKYGLPLPGPVMPAAGVFGFGDAYRDLIPYEKLGALVTNPVSWRRRHAAQAPRFARHGEHVIVHTGLPNPGVRRIVRTYAQRWERLAPPIIVHLLTTTPDDVARACGALSGAQSVLGIELGLADDTPPREALALLDAARTASLLPLIVRLPHSGVERLALPLAEAGADALTLTAPPRVRLPGGVRGRLYGRALFPLLLHRLTTWGERLSVPIIACGGIASAEEARACLNHGAAAVQIDALLWRDPQLLTRVAAELTQPLPADSR